MATVKKSNKKKIIIPICIILVIAIVAGSVITAKAKAGMQEVSLTTISTDDIIETVSATGDVTSGANREYRPATIATCKEVFVKVGDEVKKGDVLATFDTQTLDEQITSLQSVYNDAKNSYNEATASEKSAKLKLADVNEKIAALEKQISKLEKASAKTTTTTTKSSTTKKSTEKTTTTTQKNTTTTQNNNSQTVTTTAKNANESSSSSSSSSNPFESFNPSDLYEQLATVTKALGEIADTISNLTDNVETMNKMLQVISKTISDAIATGDYSADSIAKKSSDAVAEAIRKGLIDETMLIVESGVAVDMVESAVRSVDWKSIVLNVEQTNSVQLTSAQLQLAALYAEREIFSAAADTSVADAQKQVMDTTGDAISKLKESRDELSTGWVASMDGTVTECSLVAGGQTTALETGIKLESMDTLVATISLGEYDVHRVKVGMQATIKTAFGSYTGEVATIAPTATGGSSGSILDSVGSMAGISGLSSLTSSGAGVECTVTINDPDENIIIGFDADVEIQTGDYSGVPTVPIESIIREKDGTYVYKYDEEDSTVTKTKIEIGASSDTSYEIESGLKIGDKIISAPASDYEEDTFKVKVK